jgi:hypothetical protein
MLFAFSFWLALLFAVLDTVLERALQTLALLVGWLFDLAF